MRHNANFRKYARPRPQRLQRLCTRDVNTLRFMPEAFARFTAFLFDLPCCSLTRRRAFSSARFSSFALKVEEILAILVLCHWSFVICPSMPRAVTNDKGQMTNDYFVNGIPNSLSNARPSSSVLAVVTIEMFMPRVLSTLLKSISGKINWSFIPIV